MNVTRDTPFKDIAPGGDITKALQWACSQVHEHQRQLFIPAGKYSLSETISLPPRTGFTLLGSGWGNPDADHRFAGVRTVLQWNGDEGGAMIRYTGKDCRIGNFAMDGNGKAAIGLLIDKGEGIGTGKAIIEPLVCTRLKHGVQVGTNHGTAGCDCLQLEWLEGSEVEESVLRMVNAMGMSITVEFLQNISNGRTGQVGVLVDGGGMLWVQSSLTTHKGTLCKVSKDAESGKNNGFFRFSNTKADAQAKDGFVLLDCEKLGQCRFMFDGGINSSQACRIKVAGADFVHLIGFSSKFTEIEGTSHPRWGTPTVLLDACRCWNDPTKVLRGDVDLRMRDCTDWNKPWPDYPEDPAIAELRGEIEKLRNMKATTTLTVPDE